ncbi:hypothetical protein VTK56DRAFT_4443 [Thermocarpiscus australiensis]
MCLQSGHIIEISRLQNVRELQRICESGVAMGFWPGICRYLFRAPVNSRPSPILSLHLCRFAPSRGSLGSWTSEAQRYTGAKPCYITG